MKPQISILMPCYNAVETLPRALASLLYQSFTDWECVIVDDASEQETESLVNRIHDKRIRFHRLDRNQGRGAARQVALERAQGQWIGMLDADDWIYSNRLESFVTLFKKNPNLQVIASGMVVVSVDNRSPQLVRSTKGDFPEVHTALKRPQSLPIAFAPTFLRADVARSVRYDASLKASEDFDYLLQLLMQHTFVILPQMDYVYTQPQTIPIESVLSRLHFNHQIYAKYFRRFPITSLLARGETAAKALAYRALARLGVNYHTVRKMQPISVQAFEQFDRNRKLLDQTIAKCFPAEWQRVGAVSNGGKNE